MLLGDFYLSNFLTNLYFNSNDHKVLFQPLHKGRSIKKWFVEIGVKELDWPAQNSHLNPIEHLWNEFERRLRDRPDRPTSVPDLTNALVA